MKILLIRVIIEKNIYYCIFANDSVIMELREQQFPTNNSN